MSRVFEITRASFDKRGETDLLQHSGLALKPGETIKAIEYSAFQKLKLENKVLKEKLSVAESQIEDLKSQIAYWENGGGVS